MSRRFKNLLQPSKIPEHPGVYIFERGKKTVLYVGKATNLKKRLSSYWQKSAGDKVRRLLADATRVTWIETESEIDALLKEAELIKGFRPKYNVLMRDDKNYAYIGITKEAFPKIFPTHQLIADKARYIGPFTSGSALKETVRLLRRIFPYCTCRKPHKRLCLNAQIGRCPGYCCFETRNPNSRIKNREEYEENIQNIIAVLSGGKKKILIALRREMRIVVKKQDFERAARLRDQIAGLENVFSHRMPWKNIIDRGHGNWNKIKHILQTVLGIKSPISRVEGYDISNISGAEATGSMVVFKNGMPEKSEYRKFRIKTVHGANDVAMHNEVIKRRLQHSEWPYPDLMLIDGGKPQFNAAKSAFSRVRPYNPIVGSDPTNHAKRVVIAALAKKEEELYTEKRKHPIRLNTLPRETALFLQHVRNESHRFAKKYHHALREKLYRVK
jgi:excinuclease ABC subunit C